MKRVITLLAGIALAQLATAQTQVLVTPSTLTYTQNFDGLDTGFVNSTNLPTGWAIFEYGTSATVSATGNYKGDDGYSNAGDVYSYGTSRATDRALGSIASGTNIPSYGVTFVNNTGVAITGFTLTYTCEEWRSGGSSHYPTPDTTRFLYSTSALSLSDTASALWTEDVNGMLNTPNLVDTLTGAKNGNAAGYFSNKSVTETLNIPNGYHLTLRWQDKNILGSDDGLAIDNVNITFTTAAGTTLPSGTPLVASVSPADGATGVAPGTNLVVTFNTPVQAGAGNITIKDEAGAGTVVTVPSSSVTVSGAAATITGVALATNKTYHVTFDPATFTASGNNSTGIIDSTIWRFKTSSSVVTADSLNENFTNCLPTGWVTYSVTGPQVWACSTFGVAGSGDVQMNGYVTGTGSVANDDWLITPKLDLSQFASVGLQFDAEKDFDGTNLDVKVSSNYSGAGDPTTSTWTSIGIDFSAASAADSGVFHTYLGSLNNYKAQPFFIAFEYNCTTAANSAARWNVDNVQTVRTTGLSAVSKEKLQLTVIGYSTTSNINLMYTAAEEGNNQISVYDITGRMVHTENIHVNAGTQRIAVTNLNLLPGMYIVKLSNDHSYGVVKTTVQ